MEAKLAITTFYKFFQLQATELEGLKKSLLEKGNQLGIRGLLLIGEEGINSTLSGDLENLNQYKEFLLKTFNLKTLNFKDSWANTQPFRRWKVKIRKEIVTIGQPGLIPESEVNHHLSPDEWDRVLKTEDVSVFDTRNFYETKIGKFKTAIDPKINDFKEFVPFVEKSEIPKDKKILIYCTGGIRCEKAILDLNDKGYKNVYQLDGGILNYLKEKPNQEFEGECFVFDHRVAVDQSLNPSQTYSLCPHCGNPGAELIECIQCQTNQYVCEDCLAQENEIPTNRTCSKNCAHHYKLGHNTKKPHRDGYRTEILANSKRS